MLFTASDLASITSHIHSWVLFLLWLHAFILSGVISPLISSSILGTYRPGEFLFLYPIILPFQTVCGFLKAGILKWFAIPFSIFCQTSPPWPAHLGWPYTAWLSFIELDKAVVRVIRLTSFLWVWFQCVCPLMPSRNPYHLTWVSLWMWGISSWLLQQSSAAAPYLRPGVSHYRHPSWPWTWSSSFQPSCAGAAKCCCCCC